MLQATDPIGIIIENLIEWLQFWSPFLLNIIVVICIWIILLIISSFITRFLRKRAVHGGMSADAINGLILGIRLIFIWIAIVVLTAFLPPQFLLWVSLIVGDASVIIGLAVGIAISAAMRNFVAGIYVLFTDPFDVGDYVRIGGNEGIVLEVSMNYTKLRQIDGSVTLIPNNTVMSSSVTNFKFDRKRRKKKKMEPAEGTSMPSRIWQSISKVIDPSDLIQYTLELEFPIEVKEEDYAKFLSDICKRWEQKFGFEPVFSLVSISSVSLTYAITIFVENPQLLIEHRTDFIEDIARTIY
ncbi:mechanosensitive ion channel [Candidatus Bathyarchaeota archaeon]|nr:mechanosensitive ion channel [Candidatus Bathyarchaeota archaeon]